MSIITNAVKVYLLSQLIIFIARIHQVGNFMAMSHDITFFLHKFKNNLAPETFYVVIYGNLCKKIKNK